MITIALIGNQNSGKTTLFNKLTGSNQHVGNFPGVTVEKKTGQTKGKGGIEIVDLPGIYSLSPYSDEEIVTRDYLLKDKPDGIINIVDVTNIERNLYLTLQLLELSIPTVLAVNMMDELTGSGGSISASRFSEELGIPVVPISAAKGEGIDELLDAAIAAVKRKKAPERVDFCTGACHRCIHSIAHQIEDHANASEIPPRFAASKLVEGDDPMKKTLDLSEDELSILEHSVSEMERETGTDRESALADMRYAYIGALVSAAVKKPGVLAGRQRSEKADRLLTGRIFGLPLFFLIMFLIFYVTFSFAGPFFGNILEGAVSGVSSLFENAMVGAGVNEVVIDLVTGGIFAGVGAVLSFLPIIVVLFFFLSLLEDTGYMARIAYLMDKPLRAVGLSGRSFVPMLIGFGCTVPAVMATRTLGSERDRRLTVILLPFMSCSAKLPVYAVFSAAFFPQHAALVMMGLYLFGIIVAVLSAYILKKTTFSGNSVPFIMELPNYRLPSPKTVLLLMWDKAKDFLLRAFTIIFFGSLIIWFLGSFDFRFNYVADASESILGWIGSGVSIVFAPLGFGDWRAATALISGFTAKEAVLSSLAVLTGAAPENLGAALQDLFTPLSAAAFLVFILFYTPCIAAVAAIKRESGTLRAAGIVLFQCSVAYLLALLVFQLGSLFL